jgi:hypothetical protein
MSEDCIFERGLVFKCHMSVARAETRRFQPGPNLYYPTVSLLAEMSTSRRHGWVPSQSGATPRRLFLSRDSVRSSGRAPKESGMMPPSCCGAG